MTDTIVPVVPVVPTVQPVVEAPAPVGLPEGVPQVGKQPRNDGVPKETANTEPLDAAFATGNAALDVAISTFVSVTGAKSSDVERAVSNAIEYDNPDLIDRAFLKEKFGKHAAQAIALAEAAVKDHGAQVTAGVENAKRTVAEAAGSEANWKQAVSVFNSTATPTIKAAVKALMDQGNVAGGAELLLQHVGSSGLLPQVNSTLNGGSGGGAPVGLSSAQFQTELSALRKEAGNRSFETGPLADKYNQLIARRSAGKKLGL